jgi:hypothetical protein
MHGDSCELDRGQDDPSVLEAAPACRRRSSRRPTGGGAPDLDPDNGPDDVGFVDDDHLSDTGCVSRRIGPVSGGGLLAPRGPMVVGRGRALTPDLDTLNPATAGEAR